MPSKDDMSIRRMWRPLSGLGSGVAVLFLSGPTLQLQAGQQVSPPPNRVLVHNAIKYDLSAPLSMEIESVDEPAQADCTGLACGTSPGSLTDEDEPEPDQGGAAEPIPPPVSSPTLPAAAVAMEQTSPGPRPAVPMMESLTDSALDSRAPMARPIFVILPTTALLLAQITSCRL